MSLYAILNRRHKTVIFVALICAGAALIGDRSLGEGLGIFLIGVAFAWAVGSDYRPVHVALLLAGIIAASVLILADWAHHRSEIASYRKSVALFESNIAQFALDYPKEKPPPVIVKLDDGTTVNLSDGLVNWPGSRSDDETRALAKSEPRWVQEAQAAAIELRRVPRYKEPAIIEPPAFTLKASLSSNWQWIVLWLLLACLGLGLVVGVKLKAQPDRNES